MQFFPLSSFSAILSQLQDQLPLNYGMSSSADLTDEVKSRLPRAFLILHNLVSTRQAPIQYFHQSTAYSNFDHAQRHYRKFDRFLRRVPVPNSVHNALHLSIRRQATFRLPRLRHSYTYSNHPTVHAHPTPAHRRQHVVGYLCTARCMLYAGEPAVRPAATLTRSYRIIPGYTDTAENVKSVSGHILLCLAAWRIVTSSGQDRADLTFNSNLIGLGTSGG